MSDLTTNGPATKQATLGQVRRDHIPVAGSTEHRRVVPPHTFGPDLNTEHHKHGKSRQQLKQVPRYVRPRAGGATRSRDTQVAPHPMRTARTVVGSLRSSKPAIRRSAIAAALKLGVIERSTTPKPIGWRRPKTAHRAAVPFVRRTRKA